MAELELETIERAVRWCAEAGRQATPGEVRAALGSLGWDQLLAVRALLADPPPARPLGPHALADLSRGLPADLAAEREREGRYPRSGAALQAPAAPAPPPRRKSGARSRRAQVVVRKAPPAGPAAPPLPPRLPLFEELLLPVGRATLGRLIRLHGGRRPRLVGAMRAAYRRADGAPVGDGELDAALEHHGLDRAFARRERDELMHAVRAAGAVLTQAAAALGHDRDSLGAAITRLALEPQVQRLRETRRRDLRARATLAERALLLVGSSDKLADLELLEEFERDLKQRLPEHLRALSTTGEPLELGLARSLSLPGATVRSLLARLGVELRASPTVAPAPRPGPVPGLGERHPPRRPASPMRLARPQGGRPPRDRPRDGRPSGVRPSAPRPSTAGPSRGRPSSPRPPSGRVAGPRRPAAGRAGSRPAGPRRSGPGGGRPRPGR